MNTDKQELRKKVQWLYNSGRSITNIARECNVKREWVKFCVRMIDNPWRITGEKPEQEIAAISREFAKFRNFVRKGVPLSKIMTYFKVGEDVINEFQRRYPDYFNGIST